MTGAGERIRARWVLVHRAPLVLVRGWQAGDVLRRHGFHAPYSGLGKGWVVDDTHLADVAAIASMVTIGYRLVHEDSTDCTCTVAPRERRDVDVDPSVCHCADLERLPAELVDVLGAVELEHVHRGAA